MPKMPSQKGQGTIQARRLASEGDGGILRLECCDPGVYQSL